MAGIVKEKFDIKQMTLISHDSRLMRYI